MVEQDFGRQNDSMSRPTVDSTHMSRPPLNSNPPGTNMTDRTTTQSDLVPVGTKSPKHTPLTLTMDSPTIPTNLPEENVKSNVLGDPYPDPSFSDSSKKSNLSNVTNSSKSKKKICNENKSVGKTRKMTHQTHHRAAILIRQTIVITDTNGVRGGSIIKRIR